MTSVATYQPIVIASKISYSYEIKQHIPLSTVSLETRQSFCQQSSLIQLAKSLLAVSFQQSEVSCLHAG